jgi:putative peptide zinc metalloprotease protein
VAASAATATAVSPGMMPAGRRLAAAPSRAREVQLLGRLAGSGYQETPTLIRRGDGQMIKLTPLLYELVDAIDGHRGHEELAAALSHRVGKQVTAGDVEFLIEHKLRPLGVLQAPDGAEPEVERANPLLALRPRVTVSKPELTRRLTTPFVWLFRPTIMLPVLLAFAVMSGWLLLDKGLSSALHQALYEPGLILIIWALIVVSAAFHEVGHAAACRYGGARPGVIGGGLYLIWPAFYTEVSDAYRLDRPARLRVDLGGLYFSAIFALATVGLWALSGADALLLVVAVQLLQMVRQLAPFIRADGYHIIADLVGVPDLFAHIKPTLLGMLPTRWGRPQHRALKPWARAIVTAWVSITVPLLIAVLGFLVLAFPRLAATAWDSVQLRWAETTSYWETGDLAGVVMSTISIVLVFLPVLGIIYLLSHVGRRIGRRAWRGTAGRPRLRALALLGAGALAASLAWAWWPGERYRPIDPAESGPLPTVLVNPVPAESVQFQLLSTAVPAPTASTAPAPVIRLIHLLSPGPLYPPSAVVGAAPDILAPLTLPPPAGDDGQEAAPSPSPLDPPAPAAPGVDPPTPAAPGTDGDVRSAWPFPFDPPDAAEPGDNRAMAVNTIDGSMLWDFAVSLLLLDAGDPVLQANEAHAYASCSNCVTGAVAFQVILIVGEVVEEIAPINAAVAANYRCEACYTFAFAYQIVATITEAPSPEIQRELELALQRLVELEAMADSLPVQEIYLALEDIRWAVLDALEGILAFESTESTATTHDGGAGRSQADDTATPDPPQAEAESPTEEPGTDGAAEDAAAEPAEDAAAEPAEDAVAEGTADGGEVEDTGEQTGAGDITGESPANERDAATPTTCDEAIYEESPVDDQCTIDAEVPDGGTEEPVIP